jgi:hypothetical protein
MKFKKEDLQNLVWDDCDEAEWEIIEDTIIENSRWSILHRLIYKYDGKFYQTSYSVGATENQDEQPFEYDDDIIECREVEPVQVTVTKYVIVKCDGEDE